jgi:hypothetical protein
MNDFYLFLLILLFLIVSDRSLSVMILDCQSSGPGSIPGGRIFALQKSTRKALLSSVALNFAQLAPGMRHSRWPHFCSSNIERESPAFLCRIETFLSFGSG